MTRLSPPTSPRWPGWLDAAGPEAPPGLPNTCCVAGCACQRAQAGTGGGARRAARARRCQLVSVASTGIWNPRVAPLTLKAEDRGPPRGHRLRGFPK